MHWCAASRASCSPTDDFAPFVNRTSAFSPARDGRPTESLTFLRHAPRPQDPSAVPHARSVTSVGLAKCAGEGLVCRCAELTSVLTADLFLPHAVRKVAREERMLGYSGRTSGDTASSI